MAGPRDQGGPTDGLSKVGQEAQPQAEGGYPSRREAAMGVQRGQREAGEKG